VDTVSIKIPASPQYVQIVRLIAAGLASRLKFTIDEIEDLKIGVDELAAYLIGTQGRAGTLEITFVIVDERIEIRGTGSLSPGQKLRTNLTEFSRQLLETVVDEASLTQDGTPGFRLVKSKRS
jgi:serine/threonine-protein kinase RsbW